jgi:hypothetical protein
VDWEDIRLTAELLALIEKEKKNLDFITSDKLLFDSLQAVLSHGKVHFINRLPPVTA